MERALPRSHPHAPVLAPERFKGLNPYLTAVSRKPPREQGRIKAEVGRKSPPWLSAAHPCPVRDPKRWAGGGRVREVTSVLTPALVEARGRESSRHYQHSPIGITPPGAAASRSGARASPGDRGRWRLPAAARSCPPQASSKPYL